MFDPILVPLDSSLIAECVLPHTVAMARAFNAKVTLLRVLAKDQQNVSAQLFDLLNWQIHKAEAALYLEKINAQLQQLGLQTEATVQEGLGAESIIEFAQNHSVKLIILSSHGHSGVSQWGVSSVTQKVILSAPTSFLIVRAQQPSSTEGIAEQVYQRILIPLDGSQRAENVLPMSTHLARIHQAEIHISLVLSTPEMVRQMPPTQEDVELFNRLVARNREEAVRYLDQVQQSSLLNGIPVQTHLLISENVPTALHQFVEQENIDLVTLSAHGHSGNHQWPYGSMVNNFILYSTVPLLIVQDQPVKEDPLQAQRAAISKDMHTAPDTIRAWAEH